jgi:hypothetical protein
MVIIVGIFCSKAIEEGDESYCLLLLLCNTTIEEGDDNLLPLPFPLQQNIKEDDNSLPLFFFKKTQRSR